MKFIPENLTRSLGRQVLTMQKHSPRALFIGGIVGVGVSTVLACRATLKLEKTLEGFKFDVDEVSKVKAEIGSKGYTQSQHNKNVAYVYAKGCYEIVKLYTPTIIIGGISVAALTSSHLELSRRNANLMAAYSALQTSFDAYRERVKEELGEEKEAYIRNGITKVTETVDGKKQVILVSDPNKRSPYARLFDEYNPNWTKDSESNKCFIMAVQTYLNNLLQARGHVFLNEAYEALGMEHSKAGAVCGWVIGNGDNFIDFGIFDVRSRDFVHGQEVSILLDFNVDGVIYDKIGG